MGYRHRQIGWVWFALADVMFITGVVLLAVVGDPFIPAGAILMVVSLVVVGASILTVTVDDRHVTASFAAGWPRRRIPLAEIVGAAPATNKRWWGYGIRKIPGGWMYNVWGTDAVEIRRRSGKVFRIGTDEPDALAAAIDNARS